MAGAALRQRLLAGAVGGIVGTAFMTMAMRRLHAGLPAEERYPLPPREITERVAATGDEVDLQDMSLASHFGFGAVAGSAMIGAGAVGPLRGAAGGLAVWLGSYLGWIPATDILRPATTHPARRNLLMLLVHLVWGATTALTATEMLIAQKTILRGGALKDAQQ